VGVLNSELGFRGGLWNAKGPGRGAGPVMTESACLFELFTEDVNDPVEATNCEASNNAAVFSSVDVNSTVDPAFELGPFMTESVLLVTFFLESSGHGVTEFVMSTVLFLEDIIAPEDFTTDEKLGALSDGFPRDAVSAVDSVAGGNDTFGFSFVLIVKVFFLINFSEFEKYKIVLLEERE